MIDFYAWNTSNGKKVALALAELGLEYRIVPIDIGKDVQFSEAYLAVNPNGKIPAITDLEGDDDGRPLTVFESGAILIYLADKTGRLLRTDRRGRYAALQWLMFQMAGVGPTLGQIHHFLRAAPTRVEPAIERFGREARRLYGVMDRHLADHDYFADDYSIADIAIYPWVARHDWQQIDLADFPAVARWYAVVGERPAVRQGLARLAQEAS